MVSSLVFLRLMGWKTLRSLANYGKIAPRSYDGQRGRQHLVVDSLLTYGREGGNVFSLLFEEGGGYMGLYEIASLILQAATLLVGILTLCASRKNDRQVVTPDGQRSFGNVKMNR